MKIKKLAPVLALAMGFSLFSGCTGGDQKVSFGNYWDYNALTPNKEINETLVYDVTFDAAEKSLVDYSLQYSNGTYTTNLQYDVAAEAYVYTTILNITAEYTLNDQTEVSQDSVVTEVRFREGARSLQPISSKKVIAASTPLSSDVKTVSDCFATFQYTIETTYNEDCSEGKTVKTRYVENSDPIIEEKTFEIEQKKLGYLDNEQLIFALRAMAAKTSSAKLQVYSPFAEAVQKVGITFNAEESAEFTFLKNGTEETKALTYRPASIVLDEKNPGATQTAWVAKTTDSTKNEYRNVVLKLETPLSYGLGSLIYTLKSANWQ